MTVPDLDLDLDLDRAPLPQVLPAPVPAPRPAHRSFRLTRSDDSEGALRPRLVLPERDALLVLAEVARQDVHRDGCFAGGPSGVDVWSGSVRGPADAEAQQVLGGVAWSWETPSRHFVTVDQVTVTAAGRAAGLTPEALLARVLGLVGLAPTGARPPARLPLPRDPFRSSALRRRV